MTRRLKGVAAKAAVVVGLAGLVLGLWTVMGLVYFPTMDRLGVALGDAQRIMGIVMLASAIGAVVWLVKPFQERLGYAFYRVKEVIGASRYGEGGSARFQGLSGDWARRWKPGGILLGASLYDPGWWVGHVDDRHLLTIASTRSGKGRSAIIPNLLTWPHSALVIDPKGTNAIVTAARRGHGGGRVTETLGQVVHVLDPFETVPGASCARFNPLASLDPSSRTIVEDVANVVDALVVPGKGKDAEHFDQGARSILSGLIVHTITTEPEEHRTLLRVRDLLTSGEEEFEALLGAMSVNFAAGGLAADVANRFSEYTTEIKNFISNADKNTEWLRSLAMREVFSGSDLEIGDLKREPTTIYLVLPPEYLDIHKRFLRLFVNLALEGVTKAGRGGSPVLFILDEFYALGRMDKIAVSSGELAEYGVKLWPILQNVTQGFDLYEKNFELFTSGAGAVQVFGINDHPTETWVRDRLGMHALDGAGARRRKGNIVNLRETEELGRETARHTRNQIVKPSGESPLLLGRLEYDKVFPKSWWNEPEEVRPEDGRQRAEA